MSLEADIRSLLADLVAGRVYPDVPPDVPAFPYITYQQVGGVPLWFSDRKAMPSHKNARLQFNVWAKSRLEANTICRALEDRLGTSSMLAEPFTAPKRCPISEGETRRS